MTTEPREQTDTEPDEENEQEPEPAGILERMPAWSVGVTVVVLAIAFAGGFVWLAAETFAAADGDEPGWSRRVFIFQALFAIVTAIVGAVFGTSVYRPQLKRARGDARKAEERARREAREAGEARGEKREHGERRAAEARERVLDEAIKRARKPRLLRAEQLEDADRRASLVREFRLSDEVAFMPAREGESGPDVLTLDDLATAVEAARDSGR